MITRSRTLPSRPALIGAAALSSIALAAALAGPAFATDADAASSATSTSATVSATASTAATLSEAVARGLAFSREEERMARDLYAALAKIHAGATPMSRITTSEQRHYDAIGTLLTRYGVADPSAGRVAGSYADAELQKLYDDWLARGKASLQAAYQVGIELEQRDIADLKKLSTGTAPDDIKAVYANLLRGSENHLRAFQNAAAGKTTMGSGQNGRASGPGAGQNGRGQGAGRMGAGQGTGQNGPGAGQNGPGAGQRHATCDGTPDPQGTPGAGGGARRGQGRMAS